jgi:hypothetical protein
MALSLTSRTQTGPALRPAAEPGGGGGTEQALPQSSFGRQRFDVEAPRTADIGPRGPVLRYSNHFSVRQSRGGPSGTLQIGEKIEPGLPTTRIGTTSTRTVALIAIGMIFGSDRKGNSDQMAHQWTAWLLGQPFGRWAVGAVGLGFLMTGAGVAVRGLQAKFKRQIEANKQKREVVTALGVAGFVARGFVFAMIGIFLLFAAIHARSSEAKGIAGVLRTIQHYP